jgi:hypothetical protein
MKRLMALLVAAVFWFGGSALGAQAPDSAPTKGADAQTPKAAKTAKASKPAKKSKKTAQKTRKSAASKR